MRIDNLISPVLWICHEASLSGANISLLEYIKALHDKGVEQILIVPSTPKDGEVQKKAEQIGIKKVIPLKYYKWTRSKGDAFFCKGFLRMQMRNLICVLQLLRIIKKNRVSLIVSYTSTVQVGAWAGLLSGKKHFWRITEFGEEDFGFHLSWGKYSYKFMAYSSDMILLNSIALLNKYIAKNVNKNKLKVLYNLVNINVASKTNVKENGVKKLLLLGQILSSKGQLDAIHAIAILKQNGVNVHLSIVGKSNDAHYLSLLQSVIKEQELFRHISISGFNENVASLIQSHDVLLICSRCEAFGRVTAEAMKLGTPVIGAAAGGTIEMIEHGETGLLYEVENVQQLAENIEYLLANDQLQDKIIKQGKVKIGTLTNPENLFKVFRYNIIIWMALLLYSQL